MPPLAGRVVAITGASAGIGRALALQLGAAGARVALSARRADRLAALAAEIRAAGGTALDVPGDVTAEGDMDAFVARTVETFGRLDVMVCGAGIGYHGTLDDTASETMRRLVDVNLLGTLYAARAALLVMRRQHHGHLIAISSIVARRGVEGSSVYGATKAAQLGLIESLRAEFAGSPLHASVVLPVATITEFHDAMARDFGIAARGQGPRQPADVVARAIVRCIERPTPEVYPYRPAWWLAVLSVVAPATADRLAGRFRRQRVGRNSSPHDRHTA